MKKKLIAIAVGAAAIMPALAMADVSIYGRAHVSVDFLDDGADYSETNLSSNSSRLGFKGDHQINPDLKAFFQIEQEVLFGSEGDSKFNTRDTFVGLKGDQWGAIQLGRFDSPFKVARGPANLFGDQLGDMRNLTRVSNSRFDERYDNTIQYTTPDFSGFNMKLAYSVHAGGSADLDHDSDSISTSLNYAGGPFEASLAYEKAEEETRISSSVPVGDREGVRLAAAYKLTDAFKLVGFYQTVKQDSENLTSSQNDQLTADTYGLGGEYKLTGNTALKAMWMTRDVDADDRDSDMLVVGVEHKLDKAVRIYANYAMVDNDDNIGLTPWGQGRSAAPGSDQGVNANGEEASGFSVGLRYDF
ncbi:MAG: porin [Pseudomonas sp.]